MELLKKKILEVGRVEGEGILKVDSFLNHQLDIPLLNAMGKEFAKRFKSMGITKVLTAEVSGIAIAVFVGQYLEVPVVFAKKTLSKNLDRETYEGEVYSYTKGMKYKIRVSKRYLFKEDKVLIIDDFLAEGQAILGLKEIIDEAHAELMGVGIVIEKGFQQGGKIVRDLGINLKSLVIVDSMKEGKIIFRE
ncbi:xanthine phosphoribosyltransferase [Alkaliphilus serpentinus]|uniref:Xanthine phosphoribosyltransferase n=1 Tax=Alkaliphilus serpentinus TaxID=1482731 RepID=A0A833HQ88_9FIRM|nr:xanthine phosphoribosyltransferase [Alkaliphilus serpentinus]KAB3531512.1 xanthine phosphoribosyltransferase [Alkaliphilus serpentinus]